MKSLNKKLKHLFIFFTLFNIPLHSAEFEINFINAFDESSISEVIQELKYEDNIKDIKIFLDKKKWIERYEIKRNFFKPSSINIFSRKPIFIWNNNSFVDKEFVIFQKSENSTFDSILSINCPRSLLDDIFYFVQNPIEISENSLVSIDYNSVEGWIFQYEQFQAKLGKNLDNYKFENLSKTMEYLYAKRKNPSIVDLRSNAGVALKYDK